MASFLGHHVHCIGYGIGLTVAQLGLLIVTECMRYFIRVRISPTRESHAPTLGHTFDCFVDQIEFTQQWIEALLLYMSCFSSFFALGQVTAARVHYSNKSNFTFSFRKYVHFCSQQTIKLCGVLSGNIVPFHTLNSRPLLVPPIPLLLYFSCLFYPCPLILASKSYHLISSLQVYMIPLIFSPKEVQRRRTP